MSTRPSPGTKPKKIVLAYSGGLDTSVILRWLIETYGSEVVAFTADLGQGEELIPIRDKAFRTGAGVPYASYGEDAVEAQAALNRPAFVNELVAQWIPQIPDVAALLADSNRPTRVADVGCGLGWAAMAREGAPTLTLLAVALLLNAMMQVPYCMQLAYGLSWIGTVTNGTGVLLVTPLMLLLVQRYGMLGGWVFTCTP